MARLELRVDLPFEGRLVILSHVEDAKNLHPTSFSVVVIDRVAPLIPTHACQGTKLRAGHPEEWPLCDVIEQ